MTSRECGWVPFPRNGAYGEWACERRRWHLGPHRFVNYTIARIPRVWRVGRLWRAVQTDRRLRRYGGGYSYRRALFPTKYQPVPGGTS